MKTTSGLIAMLSASLTALPASSTKLIHDNFSTVEVPMTTEHAITTHRRPWMANCVMMVRVLLKISSLHPLITDVAKAMCKLIPELKVHWHGLPNPQGQHVCYGSDLEKVAKYDNIKKLVKHCQWDPLWDILGYTKDQFVSCDMTLIISSLLPQILGLTLCSKTTI